MRSGQSDRCRLNLTKDVIYIPEATSSEQPKKSPAALRRLTAAVGSKKSLRGRLVRGGVSSFTLKIGSGLLALPLAIVLARTLGPEGYGVYAFALSLVTLLAIPAQMGLPTLLVREIARYQQRREWGLLRGMLTRANQWALAISVFLGLAAAGIALSPWGFVEQHQLQTFAWALVLLPLIALGNLRGAALRGLHRVVQGLLPGLLLRPGVLLASVGAAAVLGILTPPLAMALHAAAAALAFAIGWLLLLRCLPRQVRKSRPVYDTTNWAHSLLPLSLLAGMQVLNSQTGVVMLGLLGAAQDVGLYRIAVQGATLVTFSLTAINLVIGPHIAQLYASGDRRRLQKLITRSARVALLSALPVATLFIFFGDAFLALVFGAPFQPAHAALAILCVGQLFSAATGSVALILNMTGHERDTARGVAVASGLNVLLCASLIPFFGIKGAALATSVTLVCWNLLLARLAYQRTGLYATSVRRFWC